MRRGDKSSEARSAARESGAQRYAPENPCIRGHVAERYTASGACVECTRIHNKRVHEDRPEERRAYMRERGRETRLSRDTWAAEVLRAARGRARRIGVDFNIAPDDVEIPETCPVLGVPLIYDALEPRAQRPSLDRTDNSKGYVRGNVRVISFRANQIKNDATSAELEKVLAYVKAMEKAA